MTGGYGTIKELVIEACIAEDELPSFEKLTALVRQNFPASKWKKTHYAWYKSKIKKGEIEIPGVSGNVLATIQSDGADAEVEETVEAGLSMERDLHSYLATRVQEIESGLTVVENGIEYQTDAGRIDILARDVQRQLVVIELKAGIARDSALGQLLGYIGCLSSPATNVVGTVRGIIVAFGFDSRVIYAVRGLPAVKLVKYELSFRLHEVK